METSTRTDCTGLKAGHVSFMQGTILTGSIHKSEREVDGKVYHFLETWYGTYDKGFISGDIT